MRLKLSLNYHLLQLNLTEGKIHCNIPQNTRENHSINSQILLLCSEYRNERS